MADEVRHTYRIEVRVPRVAREGTTWRTLMPPDRIERALEVGGYLRDSLVNSGLFEADLVAEWFATNVRCIEYTTTVERTRELPMSVTEDGFVRPKPAS